MGKNKSQWKQNLIKINKLTNSIQTDQEKQKKAQISGFRIVINTKSFYIKIIVKDFCGEIVLIISMTWKKCRNFLKLQNVIQENIENLSWPIVILNKSNMY
jgi:hypothetical protein